jgi:hypothetical protein
MAQASSTYRVDLWKLEQLLAALKEEYEKAKLSTFHRVSFILLQIAVYTIPIVLLTWWLIADPAFGGFAESELFLTGCLLIAGAIASLAVLIPLNVPLIQMVVRQVRLDRKVRHLLPEERGAEQSPPGNLRRELWLRVLGGAMLVLVASTVVLAMTLDVDLWRVAVTLVVLGAPAYLILAKKRIPFRVVRIGFWLLVVVIVAVLGFLVVAVVADLGRFGLDEGLVGYVAVFGIPALLVLLLPGLVLVSNRYLSWLRGRMRVLDDVDRLRRSLEQQREEARETGELAVDLSSAEALRLERAEKTLIRHQRAVAIERAHHSREAAFTTFKTLAARAQLDALGPRERVLVESAIEELSVDPRPAAASGERGRYRLPVAGTEFELGYELSDEPRQVRILGIGRPGEGAAGAASSEGGADG